jgi:hypothetical protein
MRARAIEAPNIAPTIPDATIADDATQLVIASQYERATSLLRTVRSGELRERAAIAISDIERAIQNGQLESLIIPEDIVPYLGTARDAREHEGDVDPAGLNELIRGALAVSAECLVVPANADLDGAPATIAGTLRWS